MAIPVGLELGKKRVFAWAQDWPGWCRAGKTEADALAALAAYAPRYAPVTAEAGLDFPTEPTFQVVERLPGNVTTDFGAPDAVAAADRAPLTAAEAERLASLVEAAWTVLGRIAAKSPAELRKGPRGGGRDRDKMLDHVLGADAGYARKLGVKHKQPAHDDAPAVAALRDEVLAVLGAPSDGIPSVPNGWPPRYAARRIAWHALDHAWEMEDRAPPA